MNLKLIEREIILGGPGLFLKREFRDRGCRKQTSSVDGPCGSERPASVQAEGLSISRDGDSAGHGRGRQRVLNLVRVCGLWVLREALSKAPANLSQASGPRALILQCAALPRTLQLL